MVRPCTLRLAESSVFAVTSIGPGRQVTACVELRDNLALFAIFRALAERREQRALIRELRRLHRCWRLEPRGSVQPILLPRRFSNSYKRFAFLGWVVAGQAATRCLTVEQIFTTGLFVF